jgi:GNAT superfamily N-acetyltransferase
MDEEPTNAPASSVRPMREEETRAVSSLAGRVFSRLESAQFSPPSQTLVAERDGRLVGAIVPKVLTLPDRRRCGAISWLMIAPEARGLAAGGRSVEATLDYFEEHGCR